jgi:hypothetical protein
MEDTTIESLIAQKRVVKKTDLLDPTNDYIVVGVYQNGTSKSKGDGTSYKNYVISIAELLATTPITLNVIPRGTGPSIADGFWAFSAKDIYPLTPCSNIGLPTNRIQTLYMCSEIDYTSDLLFKTGANTVATITTDSRLILNYPAVGLPLANWGHTFAAPAGSVMAFHVGTSGLAGGLLTINVDGSFGIGKLAGPIHAFAGNGLDIFSFTGAINNQKVGINTLSPSATLHLKGVDSVSSSYSLKIDDVAGNPLLYVANDGFVGASTSVPNSPYSTFSHKSKATQGAGYVWADFFSPNGTTGLTIKRSGNFANWMALTAGSYTAGFGNSFEMDCTPGSEEAAIGGYPYAGGGSFRVQTNAGGLTSGKAMAIGSGEHLINQGPRLWWYGASLSWSNQQDKYGHIQFFKENAVDGDFKAYMSLGVNNGALNTATIERMKISSNGQINFNFMPTSSVGLVSGDLWYDPLAGNTVYYVP